MYSAPTDLKSFDVIRVEPSGRRNKLTAVAATNCAEQAEAIRQHLQTQLERVPATDVNYVIRQPSHKKSPIRLSPFKIENIYRAESFYVGHTYVEAPDKC